MDYRSMWTIGRSSVLRKKNIDLSSVKYGISWRQKTTIFQLFRGGHKTTIFQLYRGGHKTKDII